ncbi:hypothetical protein HGRIS_004329 [Hohenbuehelia grisea]|uniref:Uncharacterized protein n=1 Tax=Hohenbuehelia grisea TaxID=104357 RepID=A0ABR3IPF7_9AGAR
MRLHDLGYTCVAALGQDRLLFALEAANSTVGYGKLSPNTGAVNEYLTPKLSNAPSAITEVSAPPAQSHCIADPIARQYVGESRADFLKREEKYITKRLQAEELDPKAKQRRLAREENAKPFMVPGKTGAMVFEWETENGIDRRSHIVKARVPDIWGSYTHS